MSTFEGDEYRWIVDIVNARVKQDSFIIHGRRPRQVLTTFSVFADKHLQNRTQHAVIDKSIQLY